MRTQSEQNQAVSVSGRPTHMPATLHDHSPACAGLPGSSTAPGSSQQGTADAGSAPSAPVSDSSRQPVAKPGPEAGLSTHMGSQPAAATKASSQSALRQPAHPAAQPSGQSEAGPAAQAEVPSWVQLRDRVSSIFTPADESSRAAGSGPEPADSASFGAVSSAMPSWAQLRAKLSSYSPAPGEGTAEDEGQAAGQPSAVSGQQPSDQEPPQQPRDAPSAGPAGWVSPVLSVEQNGSRTAYLVAPCL